MPVPSSGPGVDSSAPWARSRQPSWVTRWTADTRIRPAGPFVGTRTRATPIRAVASRASPPAVVRGNNRRYRVVAPVVNPGAWILVVTVAAALAFGAWRRASDGRFQAGRHTAPLVEHGRQARPDGPEQTDRPIPSLLAGTSYDVQRGERGTLLQFSSAFCAPCRATRRILGDVAEAVPGVTHVEVDAEAELELVRRLGVLRTPTTLVLDAAGAEVARAAGAPRKEQVLAALAEIGPA